VLAPALRVMHLGCLGSGLGGVHDQPKSLEAVGVGVG
jgi:hypothetical protein